MQKFYIYYKAKSPVNRNVVTKNKEIDSNDSILITT